MTEIKREILADAEALAQHAAAFLVSTLSATDGKAAVALSGGSTPKRLYEILGTPPFRDRMPWDRIHWFWGDERFVPPEDPDSNYRMARLALFSVVPVPAFHIHPIPTEGLTPQEAAVAYQMALEDYYGSSTLDPARPLFDVTLLGLGEDGHTASLFPGVAALQEQLHWTAAVIGAKPEPRITLTYPALDSSRHVVFLVAGAAKHPVLERLKTGEKLPAGGVNPVGTLHWMLDRAAAGES